MPQFTSTELGAILRVGHRFQPDDGLTVFGFLHGDVLHAVLGRSAVPVLFIRRNPDRVAGADLTHRPAPSLHPSDTGGDMECLPERMGMPRRACARLEPHPRGT